MRPFDEEHLKFLSALNLFKVKYVIVGGHAAIFHGVNRNTGDLDILIEATIENGRLLIAAMKSLHLEVPEIKDQEWTSNLVLSFGLEPDAVDILNFTPGLKFNDVHKNAIQIIQEKVPVPIIDIRDLIKNKEALNRSGEKAHLDKYDIEILRKIIKSRES